jgi:hypothetical protein
VGQLVEEDVIEVGAESSPLIEGSRTRRAMGCPLMRYFASMTFLSRTFLEPFCSRTTSSFGRLNAEVCTPRRASPAV